MPMNFPEADTVEDNIIVPNSKLIKFRDWFRSAVDKSSNWRKEAHEDFAFVSGKQWRDEDKTALESQGRPAITINKIKPLINVLSGYQRLNRYDIDFLPRTNDDMQLCNVRKGVTKYIMDMCDYEYHESRTFLDGSICGVGWFEVKYQFDQEIADGEAKILRVDPFNMYVDPEAREDDFSDAKFLIRARWADKDELKLVYPKYADDIDKQVRVYDYEEDSLEFSGTEALYYQKENQKLRLVECWYKTREKETFYLLADGRMIPKAEVKVEMFMTGQVERTRTVPVNKVRVCVFFDQIMLEDIDSPYEHGEFPFVPFTAYRLDTDYPSGVVRDLKDPQREINKRRSQTLHVLNTSSNSGWLTEEGALTPDQELKLRKMGATPGAILHIGVGAMSKIQRIQPPNPPTALLQAEQQAMTDLPAISGINEALMGTDIASSASGRAIELKQKQAITHIAPMFDNLRKAKKKIANILWGRRGHKGIIPQYYTEDKVYRVEGQGGKPDFIRVNQQVQQQDPLRGIIQTTLNDLSQGEFDVVIADTQASATQRSAQMWSLVDAVSKLGVPGDLVFDIIIDLSDIPNKDDIKERWQQRQQQQAQQAQQQAQQQLELEKVKKQSMTNSISFKDAPLPIQLAMSAKAGLIPQQVADYVLQQYVQQYLPELAQQQAQVNAQPNQVQQAQIPITPQQHEQTQNNGGGALTQAAMKSLMSGQGPAM